ncbi:MAG: DUF2971 domain-containing protein [Cyclobacteriaceae bacterium]|nr:DUF2971 domain-containing protein [Cyclobacteriaceae bacterium]
MRRINEDIERPLILYKYRGWGSFHKLLLNHLEAYIPSPIDFNDPLYGHIPVRYDLLTYDDCFKMNYDVFSIFLKKRGVPEEEILRIVKEKTDSKEFAHPETVKKEDVSIWNQKIGLYSLSEVPDNILMWSHYGENHTGFCLGLWSDVIEESELFEYLEPVSYFEKYPIIGGLEDTNERFYKRFFSKSSLWSYEKEWRLTKNHIEKRKIRLPEESVAQIIIGCRADREKEIEVQRIRDKKYPDAAVFKAKVNEAEFKIDLELL